MIKQVSLIISFTFFYFYLLYIDLKSKQSFIVFSKYNNLSLLFSFIIFIAFLLFIHPFIQYFSNQIKRKKKNLEKKGKSVIFENNIEFFQGETEEIERPVMNVDMDQVDQLSRSIEIVEKELKKQLEKKPAEVSFKTTERIITKKQLFIPTIPLALDDL